MNDVKRNIDRKGKISIRASSLGDSLDCPMRWYQRYVGRDVIDTPVNVKATAGTAVHGGAEAFWRTIMERGEIIHIDDMKRATFEKLTSRLEDDGVSIDDVLFDSKQMHDIDSLVERLEVATEEYYNGVVPLAQTVYGTPVAVEEEVGILVSDSPVINAITGSIDLLFEDRMVDIKSTSKNIVIYEEDPRNTKATQWLHQLSAYSMLAKAFYGGSLKEDFSFSIHLLLLGKRNVEFLPMDVGVEDEMALSVIRNLSGKLEILYNNPELSADVMFNRNYQSNMCSPKFCGHYDYCARKLII